MTRQVYGETSSNATTKSTGSSGPGAPDPLFSKIDNIVSSAKNSVSAWQDKQDKFYRMRMRVKKDKNYPFKDSSNLRMPTADINIKKVKASIIQQIFGARPVVSASPTPSGSIDSANKIEKFIDHIVMDIMDLRNKAEICVDQSLEKGFYIGKVFWRLEIVDREEVIDPKDLSDEERLAIAELPIEAILPVFIDRLGIDMDENVADENIRLTERAIIDLKTKGKKVKFTVKDVIYNFPDADFISPDRVFVPTDTGFDPQKATSITIESFLPLDYIKANGKRRGWDMSIVYDIQGLASVKEENSDLDRDAREGIDRLNNPSKLVRIWETYGTLDINETGVPINAVVTSLPDFKKVVRSIRLDNFTHKYNIVKFFYELTEDRWFSHRGIPEALEDIIKEIDVQHNMKIDGQTMRNAPMIVYRAGMVNPRTARVNPAGAIPVQGLQPLDDTIKAINLHNPNAEFSYEREQMLLETKIQEYVGQIDFSLQSTINRREPRTLGEVELQQANASATFSLDAGHYVDSFSKLFQMVFELWCEFGPDEYEFNYFGSSSQPQTIKLTKEELQGKYNIKVRGNDQNTNPQIRLQKAQQILFATTNQTYIQMGIVGPQQMAEGLKRFYEALNIDNWETLLNVQPQPIQPDPRTAIAPKFSDLADSEQAQVLNAFGVEADAPARQRKNVMEGLQVAADISSKVGEEPDSGITEPSQPRAIG